MIKLVKIEAIEPEIPKRNLVVTIEKDGEELTSNVVLVKDKNDWVYQEEGNQRFGAPEMRAIAKELDKLNGRWAENGKNFRPKAKRKR